MHRNKYILSFCPNFYKIINFEYYKDDLVTEKLINIYRSFIFSIDENNSLELEKVKLIDKVLAKYVDDYDFRKELKVKVPYMDFLTTDNIITSYVNDIIVIYEKYLEGTTRKIYISKWI